MELDGTEGGSGGNGGGGGGGGSSAALLTQLAKDVEGLKALEAVASEHKNFHATISKLAKAAEKVMLSLRVYACVRARVFACICVC